MRPATLISASLGLSLLTLLSSAAQAGNNHGAVAFLSWDRAGTAATLNTIPGKTFPLYLQLRGLADVGQLAVFLQWAPRDTTSCGYVVGQPGPEASAVPDSLLGWVAPLDSTRTFDGDWTYNWAIRFPPTTSARRTVVYLVTPAACDSVAGASFVLRSVVVVDSQGLRDTLGLLGNAAIAPHKRAGAISLARAFPSQVPASLHGARVTVFGGRSHTRRAAISCPGIPPRLDIEPAGSWFHAGNGRRLGPAGRWMLGCPRSRCQRRRDNAAQCDQRAGGTGRSIPPGSQADQRCLGVHRHRSLRIARSGRLGHRPHYAPGVA